MTVHVVSSQFSPSLIKFRAIFCCDEKSHSGHMKAVTQSVLDGTSKWSAKIAITGLHFAKVIKSVKVEVFKCSVLWFLTCVLMLSLAAGPLRLQRSETHHNNRNIVKTTSSLFWVHFISLDISLSVFDYSWVLIDGYLICKHNISCYLWCVFKCFVFLLFTTFGFYFELISWFLLAWCWHCIELTGGKVFIWVGV